MNQRVGGRKGRRAVGGGSATISVEDQPEQLLPTALHHHERGELARARALYEQVIEAVPEHADALHLLGILCHQEGDSFHAESFIRRAIACKASVAPFYDNLGAVLEKAGRFDEAIAAFESADALEPGDADRRFNMGVALERAGRLVDAQARFGEALKARPGDIGCRFALANVLKRRGFREDARAAYREILDTNPEHPGALVNLGNLLQDDGDLSAAGDLYRRALAGRADDAVAHHNLARLRRAQNQLGEARSGFELALRHDPALVDARLGLAQTLEDLGELDAALNEYRELCRLGQAREETRSGLVRVSRVVVPSSYDPIIESALLDAVTEGRVPVSALARALGGQLRAKFPYDPALHDDGVQAVAVARQAVRDDLCRLLLENAINVDPQVEVWWTSVRKRFLLHGVDGGDDRDVLRTLVLQCIANDHVFSLSGVERDELDRLRARIEAWLAIPEDPPAVTDEELALYACYAPLATLRDAAVLPDRLAAISDWLTPILNPSLVWPMEERERAQLLPALGSINNTASIAVRAQYEESPYPRWSALPAVAAIGEVARARLNEAAERGETLDILVAGCGTGQEPLAIASQYPGHRIVGLDLSRASLAYASRMSARLGIGDVEFVHGDLLNVKSFGRRFHVVTATGVLHHMEDPLEGLRALRECLAPHGLMKIGLYSAAARRIINVARKQIVRLDLGRDDDAVRRFRARILEGLEPHLNTLLSSEDFFATSTCRDLLFHPVEHQFGLDEIGQTIDELALEFRGFELPHALILRSFQRFAAGSPLDLSAWARYEQKYPETFEAMYVLWCVSVESG